MKSSKSKTRTVHIARPSEPEKVVVSKAIKLKHQKSINSYPNLNLSEGEYVISAVRRHPIGLFPPVLVGLFLIIITIAALLNVKDISQVIVPIFGAVLAPRLIYIFLTIFLATIVFGVLVSVYVYRKNRFFLTNESVIQEIQTGLLYKHEQTVSLQNIEDASFYKNGIVQQLFNFGTIRLSTEGDETTYLFSYVSNPKREIAMLNNAVEAFKNGRPIEL